MGWGALRQMQRRSCEDGGRDGHSVATSPGMPGHTNHRGELGETKGRLIPRALRKRDSAGVMILGFWPLEL